ncbi:MAG: hypothetical protein ACRD3S_04225, partial [Terracidiphilus sp.]
MQIENDRAQPMRRYLLRHAWIPALTLLAAGCGGSEKPESSAAPPSQAAPTPQQMGSVTISPQYAALSAAQN